MLFHYGVYYYRIISANCIHEQTDYNTTIIFSKEKQNNHVTRHKTHVIINMLQCKIVDV